MDATPAGFPVCVISCFGHYRLFEFGDVGGGLFKFRFASLQFSGKYLHILTSCVLRLDVVLKVDSSLFFLASAFRSFRLIHLNLHHCQTFAVILRGIHLHFDHVIGVGVLHF